MIILKCSKCQTQLEVDDAFAGGVCRCIHCGALSQVPLQPTRLDHKGRPTVPPPMAMPVTAPQPGEQQVQIAPTRAYVAQKRMGLLAVIMMLAALGMIVIVVILAKDLFKTGENGDHSSDGGQPEQVNPFTNPPTGPAFVTLPLPSGDVAYLLNDGSSMRDVGDAASVAIEVAARRGKDKFVVIPWVQGNTPSEGPPSAYPKSGLASGGADAAGLRSWFEELSSSQAREPGKAAEEAVKRGATVLLLITRNDPDPEVVDDLLAATKGKNVTWLAAAIDTATGDPADYAELGRLTRDVNSIGVIDASLLEGWMRELPNE